MDSRQELIDSLSDDELWDVWLELAWRDTADASRRHQGLFPDGSRLRWPCA